MKPTVQVKLVSSSIITFCTVFILIMHMNCHNPFIWGFGRGKREGHGNILLGHGNILLYEWS